MPVEEAKLDDLLNKSRKSAKRLKRNEKDDAITMNLQETVRFNEATGRYNVKMPWKLNKNDLRTNFISARND